MVEFKAKGVEHERRTNGYYYPEKFSRVHR